MGVALRAAFNSHDLRSPAHAMHTHIAEKYAPRGLQSKLACKVIE